MASVSPEETVENDAMPRELAAESKLYVDVGVDYIPIVYRDEYNIHLLGLEKLHPFDACKWGNVIKNLKKKNLLKGLNLATPNEATEADLRLVHSASYLRSLKWSINVAKIIEVAPVALVPNIVLQKRVLKPFRYQVGGSVLAGKLAIERGWSINVGGGFHHCWGNKGGGFCAYADITLTVHFILNHYPHVERVMILDLDAHQGNGHERDFIGRKDIYILDMYNKYIYPNDTYAKGAISRKIELFAYTEDEEYLDRVNVHVEGALNEFSPHVVIYNAGTDILEGDCLGLLSITKQGIIERDEIVFQKVRQRSIPIVMLTSGGYQRVTAAVIADSIANLNKKSLIDMSSH
ncbi:histone deacetylase 11-like isoform X2 [Homarus americanus]|nr:histone deacetylase 11-like isoform X2 [Homarus americanus]XP_042212155.1 histone deacetylase 11-like isoform X2 [Homarus americanus]XP_042212156.1 histone deacetylase 11-like isoform X2 [Homarus americanus]